MNQDSRLKMLRYALMSLPFCHSSGSTSGNPNYCRDWTPSDPRTLTRLTPTANIA